MVKIQRSEEKIKGILIAARKLLARKGYAGTTISLVAKEANVSRGILHYYFKNKEEMLTKVIQEDMEFSIQMIRSIFSTCDSLEDIAEASVSTVHNLIKYDPDFFRVFYEGMSATNQSPAMNEIMKALYKKFRHCIQTGLQDATDRGIMSPSTSVFSLASVITALIDGLGMQMIAEEELVDNEEIWETAKLSIMSLAKGSI